MTPFPSASACIARLLVAFAVVGILASIGCRRSAEKTPPAGASEFYGSLADSNFVLITLDTTRADQFGCYGGPPGVTPALDALAARGVLCENAYSQANVTNPSHVSIFTGLYAIDSGVMDNLTPLDPEIDTLAAAFGRAGYETAGFPSSFHLGTRNLDLHGFETFEDIETTVDANLIVDRFLEWLDETDEPFFAWLHLFDPHVPYDPPPVFRDRFYAGDPTAGDRPLLAEDPYFNMAPPAVRTLFEDIRDPRYPIQMYRAELHFADTEIARMLDALKRRGLDERTGIVVVADHGESLGEHHVYYNHELLFEPTMRIPWIMHFPGLAAGARIATTVSHVDLAPTVCDLYGIELQQSRPMHGRNLADAFARGVEPHDATTTDEIILEHSGNRWVGVRKGPWKLMYHVSGNIPDEERVELYDVLSDPDEEHDVAAERPDVVKALLPSLTRWIEHGVVQTRRETAHPQWFKEQKRRLRQMGYLVDDDDDETDGDADAPTAGPPGLESFRAALSIALSPEMRPTQDQRLAIEAAFKSLYREIRRNADNEEVLTRARIDFLELVRPILDDRQRAYLAEQLGDGSKR